jgi:uncharacterized protein YxeA
MKKIIISIFTIFAIVSCQDMAKKVEDDKLSTDLVKSKKTSVKNIESAIGVPEFSFVEEEHDFGLLVDGEKVSYSFVFTNTGDAPLIISNAKGSCGCTVPNWPKDPIAPGKTGTIDVSFNSSGRKGIQNKAVTLTANTNPNRKVIKIKAEIQS